MIVREKALTVYPASRLSASQPLNLLVLVKSHLTSSFLSPTLLASAMIDRCKDVDKQDNGFTKYFLLWSPPLGFVWLLRLLVRALIYQGLHTKVHEALGARSIRNVPVQTAKAACGVKYDIIRSLQYTPMLIAQAAPLKSIVVDKHQLIAG
jgi:hypothetical protein